MASVRLTIIVASLLFSASARHVGLHQVQHHKHEAIEVDKRQVASPLHVAQPAKPPPIASTASTAGVFTFITPSPGAKPVAVTKMSQIVPSFVPQYTLCALPPIAFYPNQDSQGPTSARVSTAPYHSYSISTPPGNGTCTTHYKPTITMVCATTLTALVEKYAISDCHQDITFSTEYGFTLAGPTPTYSKSTLAASAQPRLSANDTQPSRSRLLRRDPSSANTTAAVLVTPKPTIETLTTYYLAPWQQLTAGTAPGDVDIKVCQTFASNDTTECIRRYEVWETALVSKTATSTTSVNISTTVHGRSQLIVETFVANVTEEVTTFTMLTTMDVEYQTEITTTKAVPRTPGVSTGPTVYLTRTVQYPSQTPA